ncbi:glycosyltransferase family 2 protein [Bdellovibrio sp. HCB337]|uniref:glycosyltransferase family 2 protein n=1 Tax=Bdellovibrio sp. HCB337 TaxID=3394358 RepID=UPI0039A69FBF
MSVKLPISLVVVTLNEEANIERCLKSVPFASDTVVVDSFSTDRTVEIAQKLGANVVQEKWRGFGPQKAFAVSQAKNDWVICLDADEALSPELQAEIQAKFQDLQATVGYELPRRSFHLGRWINHGGWYPDAQLRLFNRQHSQWSNDVLHEKVQVKHKERLKHDLLHWVFSSLSVQVITNDKYSTLGAESLAKSGKTSSLLKLIFRPWGKFMECYFIKLGFLDGLPGFIIAVGAAYSMFLRYAKLWEMEMKKRTNS